MNSDNIIKKALLIAIAIASFYIQPGLASQMSSESNLINSVTTE